MATIFFNVTTLAYSGTNTLKVVLYKASSPLAEVQAQTADGPIGETTWSFPGLDKTNYICKLLEVNPADHSIVLNQIGYFTFVPNNETYEFKEPILIEAGVTPMPGDEESLFPSNVNTATVEDWIGWDLVIERIGTGTMKRGIDYNYNIVTGEITLVVEGDVFGDGEFFWGQFMPRIAEGGGTSEVPSGTSMFTERLLVTAATTLTNDDIGKLILIKGASSYFEVELPDIGLVNENTITYFQSGRISHKCVKIKCAAGQVIDWLEGSLAELYICPNEMFALFKEVVDEDNSVWRVIFPEGNFKNVGEFISDDMNAANVFNKIELDGATATSGLLATEYARLYNRYVLRLPVGQVCAYAVWGTGNNKYKFSLKDVGTGKFRIPDLRNVFERVTDGTRLPADFQDHAMLDHQHESPIGNLPAPPFGQGTTTRTVGRYGGTISEQSDLTSHPVNTTGAALANVDDETRPKNRATKKYVYV